MPQQKSLPFSFCHSESHKCPNFNRKREGGWVLLVITNNVTRKKGTTYLQYMQIFEILLSNNEINKQ